MKTGLEELDPWKIMGGVQALQGISKSRAESEEREKRTKKASALESAEGLYAEGVKKDPATARQYAIDTKKQKAEEYNKGGWLGGAFREERPTEFKPGVLNEATKNYFDKEVGAIEARDKSESLALYRQLRANPKLMHSPEFGKTNSVAANAAIARMRREDSEQESNRTQTAANRQKFGAFVAETKNATSNKVDEYLKKGDEKLAIKTLANFVNGPDNNMPHSVKEKNGGLVRYVEYDGTQTYDYLGGGSGPDIEKARVYSVGEANQMLKDITDAQVISATANYAKKTADDNYKSFVDPKYLYNPASGKVVSMSRASDPTSGKFEFIITDRQTGDKARYKNLKEIEDDGFIAWQKPVKTEKGAPSKALANNMKVLDKAMELVKQSGRYTVDMDGNVTETATGKPAGDALTMEAIQLMPRLGQALSEGEIQELLQYLQIPQVGEEDGIYGELGVFEQPQQSAIQTRTTPETNPELQVSPFMR